MQEYIVWKAESHLGKKLHEWWEKLEEDRASRAMLRRCATLDEVALCPAYQQFYRYLLACNCWPIDANFWQNDKLAAISGLLAHVKVDDTLRLSVAMSKLDSDKLPVSELRFRDILKIETPEDLFISLRRTLPLIKHKTSIHQLAHDVYHWNNPDPKFNIPKQWAYSYRWPIK